MAAVTICSDFGPPKSSQLLFPLFPHLFAMKWWDQMPWSSFFFYISIEMLKFFQILLYCKHICWYCPYSCLNRALALRGHPLFSYGCSCKAFRQGHPARGLPCTTELSAGNQWKLDSYHFGCKKPCLPQWTKETLLFIMFTLLETVGNVIQLPFSS